MSEPDAQPMAPAEVASVRHEPVGSHLVRAARRGGKRKRHDTLLIADIALPAALDLKTHAQRMAVLEAVAVLMDFGQEVCNLW